MDGFSVGFSEIFSSLRARTVSYCCNARNTTKAQFLLCFKHFAASAHKAKNNLNSPKIAEKTHIFGNIVFERILEGFWMGFDRSKTFIFAFFSMFFRCHFSSTVRKAKKSTKMGQQDTESDFLGLGSGDPQAAGERKG